MKHALIIILVFIAQATFSQSAQLSTFEEMWIVEPTFSNLEIKEMVALAPESMTYEKLSSAKSITDLNKTLEKTAFLVLKIGDIDGESQRKYDTKTGSIGLKSLYGPSRQLNGEAEWVAVTKDKMGYNLIIPTHHPEKLKEYFTKNNFTIKDETGKLQNMTIKEIRIENGTYGKTY
ncbi:hypothetical protein [Portibacter marinus]|uniref:hypothetical protein n=1 Tax=Portibacter marinus TaxID=2898660 RepID=UPI001F2C4FBC|nr:hypothetical protein [Portibacter marinus]